MCGFLLLALAIGSEVAATLALKASGGFSRPGPSAVVIAGYGLAFFFLSLSLRAIPVGIAYALWAGVGTAGVAAAGWVLFDEPLGGASIAGIALVIAGAALLGARAGG